MWQKASSKRGWRILQGCNPFPHPVHKLCSTVPQKKMRQDPGSSAHIIPHTPRSSDHIIPRQAKHHVPIITIPGGMAWHGNRTITLPARNWNDASPAENHPLVQEKSFIWPHSPQLRGRVKWADGPVSDGTKGQQWTLTIYEAWRLSPVIVRERDLTARKLRTFVNLVHPFWWRCSRLR